MVPPLRATTTQTRRSNRGGYVEHDDFEGLPVRQWRQEWVSIVPPPPPDTTQKNDIWAIELPHGMPKDANLLPQHTQDLLRAARSGRLYKRPLPVEEEEGDGDAALPEKPEKKEEDSGTKGFQVKVWKQIPRNAEGPTISHLAKRRKGTVTLASTIPAGAAAGPIITKATVRRVDAAGNSYVQEITLQEGQTVDGEIISTTVVPAPAASANADVSAAPTPVRRRPPPPKRKAKGPGRGRRKKLPLPLAAKPEAVAPTASGVLDGSKPEVARITGLKQEGDNDETKTQDSEMADDDDGDDGEDDGDEGEEGDEGDDDDGDGNDGENRESTGVESDAKLDHPMDATPAIDQLAPPISDSTLISTSISEPSTVPKQPSPLSNAALPPDHDDNLQSLHTQTTEGSPLKNVVGPESPDVLSPQPTSTETGVAALPLVLVPTVTDPPPAPVQPVAEQGEIAETQPIVDVEMTDITTDIVAVEYEQTEVEITEHVQNPAPTEDVQDVNPLPMSSEPPLEQITGLAEVSAPESTDVEAQPADEIETAPTDQGVTDSSTGPVESVADPIPAPVPSVETNAANSSQGPAPQLSESLVSTAPELAPAPTPAPAPAPTPAPASIDTQPGPESQLPAAEPEPESPDLFSGLEAALNQQGEPKEPPKDEPAVPSAEENANAPVSDAEAAVGPEEQAGDKPADA